jgi:dolichyl-phosphate beta-glucosyltransferase
LPESKVLVRQPYLRESAGRLFNLAVRSLALPGLRDTQCGFKLFRREAAEQAFGLARLAGFSFDVEVLYVARRRGLRIAEVPVTWRNDAATRVTLGGGSAAFLDIARVRWNGLVGRYDGGSSGT